MIIHITGPSGSGKTTLAQKLKKHKNLIVIDTDDIDDKMFIYLFKNNKKFKKSVESRTDEFFKIKDKANFIVFKKYIQKAKDEKKILVILGLTFRGPADPYKVADYKYYLKTDAETNYRRLFLRTLEDIKKNYSKLKTILKTEKPHAIDTRMLFEAKLRIPFIEPFIEVANGLKMWQKKAIKDGYKLVTAQEAYTKVIGIASQ